MMRHCLKGCKFKPGRDQFILYYVGVREREHGKYDTHTLHFSEIAGYVCHSLMGSRMPSTSLFLTTPHIPHHLAHSSPLHTLLTTPHIPHHSAHSLPFHCIPHHFIHFSPFLTTPHIFYHSSPLRTFLHISQTFSTHLSPLLIALLKVDLMTDRYTPKGKCKH